MRKVTRKVVGAFIAKMSANEGNSRTDGKSLYLHGNEIARWAEDGKLEICTAGWASNVTKERLNALPNVHIHQKNFQWYLNGKPWATPSRWTEVS